MKQRPVELVILSAGSEIVSLAIAEAAWNASIPYAIFSLVPHSILSRAPGCVEFQDLSYLFGQWDKLRSALLKGLEDLSGTAASRLAILPSDDGSLRLLNEWRDDVLLFGEFSRTRAIKMGGVDKAEVVELLTTKGMNEISSLNQVICSPSEAYPCMDRFGPDTVFKPALKPLNMDLAGLGGHGLKVVTQTQAQESQRSVILRLEKAWATSERWIAQPRLEVGPGVERSVCATRGRSIHACQVTEKAKYPKVGGTALWVTTDEKTELIAPASQLLHELDMVGICELSYLPDNKGHYQLIELNPRPWLQVGLLEFAGFPVIAQTVSTLRGSEKAFQTPNIRQCDWINLERTLLAVVSGHISYREVLGATARLFRSNTTLGGYSSRFPGMKSRLLKRSTLKIFS